MRGSQDPCDTEVMPIRCLIVDDNESFLRAAQILLEREGMSVVGIALTGADALRQVGSARPDVVLVDVFLGEDSGLQLAQRLVDDGAGNATVIMISTHAETDIASLMATSPAAGFLPKAKLSAKEIRRILDGSARDGSTGR
jgi:CheY-like chemotaxis protein